MEDPNIAARRDRDLAGLCHALMNPLTVVLGYAQLLSARKDLDEDVRTQVSRIAQEAKECSRLIEQVRSATSRPLSLETSRAAVADLPRRRVLVVDDEPVIQKLTAEALGRDNLVVGVSSAEEAHQRLLTESFDVVLLDLSLAGEISGRTFYENLLVHQPEIAGCVVFVTGGFVDIEVQDFVTNSGREFLQKPFHLRALRYVVARAAGA